MSEDEVSTVLSASNDWEVASRHRAVSLADHLSALVGPEPCLSSALSKHELQSHQESDVVVSRVAFFVNRKIRPSRRERAHENQQVLRILKQWERLAVIEGILYRVTKDPLTRHKRFQFVVPESLKSSVLSGIHDNAGHQGQPRTLSLARQRFFWYEMEKDVRNYVNFLPLDVSLDVTKAQSAVGVDVVPEEPGVSVGGREVESSRPSAIPSLKFAGPPLVPCDEAVSHPSTNQARPCLASEIGRDRAFSGCFIKESSCSRRSVLPNTGNVGAAWMCVGEETGKLRSTHCPMCCLQGITALELNHLHLELWC
ncbi:hypothetical protein D4764_04G0016180 [Takifugu flavidus]|uniref:Gypsy retrotransposon integrase-like protein 1 n=1 Tax=Takifugu flavidus TaxID=433684 RepID=A0A5C6N9D2_9TELE|nr:hypothetical protein D4764_04G0016180 [Takifugu flavidus]